MARESILYFLSAINEPKLKPAVLEVSQLTYSVRGYRGWFKCQIRVSNYNTNKISSLEWTEIFQIYLLVLVGFYFCPLLTYHFIMKDFLSFLMQNNNKNSENQKTIQQKKNKRNPQSITYSYSFVTQNI